MRVLVVDDDRGLRKSLEMILREGGYQVSTASDGEEGLRKALESEPDMILCDVRMPGIDGIEFVRRYRDEGGESLLLVMTAYGSLDLAVEAMRAGAYDYLPKPFGADEVLLTLRKAEEREELRLEVGRLRDEVRTERRFADVVAKAPSMVRALDVATKVAAHPTPVLITGATGTGKELVARIVHRESPRREGPFVPVNCGAVPENLLESEFFGHVKGAFSGADRDRKGLFEAAAGGTLFLDEIGELPPPLQVKLLRAIQEGEVRRVGDTRLRQVDVRIVAASNRDLQEAVEQSEFREDLYFRLAVVPIHLPPLRARTEEIPELVRHLLDRHAERLGIEPPPVERETMEVLLDYAWPGNVRELENVLERAMVLSDGGSLGPEALPEAVRHPERMPMAAGADPGDLSVKRRSAELERRLIARALEQTGGNRTRAADLLDLSPRALRYKIKDYGLDD